MTIQTLKQSQILKTMKYKIKKALVKRNQFCKYLNAMLAERLRQALCAEEVLLTNGKFYIIEGYEVTESYYGHQLVQSIGGEIPFLRGLKLIIKNMSKRKSPVLHQPKYSEVFTTLSTNEIHKCFIAYEVLCKHINSIIDTMATKYLKHVASSHLWDYDTFMDIIDEEYDCIYNK